MPATIRQLINSPDHYLHSFEGEDAIFVQMDIAAYRRSIFLDRRISCASDGAVSIPVSELLLAAPKRQTVDWIFHVAHCGSTLLARALDDLDDNLVLREPFALRQLAMAPDASRLEMALAMLSRRYPEAGSTMIKANVPVNFLLDSIVGPQCQDRAIFLHCSLTDYLLAILRSDNHRAWLRNVTTQLSHGLGDMSAFSDAERGTALWAAQMRHFAAAIQRLPDSKSLDAEIFFANPAPVLSTAAHYFGKAADECGIQAIIAGPLFNTYSKNPEHAFTNADRLARRSQMIDTISAEIVAAHRWLEKNAPDADAAVNTIASVAFRI